MPPGRALALLAALALPPAGAQPARPLVPVLDAAAVTARCERGLADSRARLAAMEAREASAGFFAEWNRLQVGIEDAFSPISLHVNVHPDPAVRSAAEPCLRELATLRSEIYQSERLHARLRSAEARNPREAKLKRDLAEGFEDSGVALPPARRERARAIAQRLEALRQGFERAVRDDATVLAFTPAQVEGVPESLLGTRERDGQGRYLLRPDDPTFSTFMANARDGEARRRMYFARFNRGGEANIARLDEAYRLRRELAGLHGLPSYAHYVQRRRMAGHPDTVKRFLGEVKAAVSELEARAIAELAAAKAREAGAAPEATRIHRWDVAYYQERVKRERFDVDQEALRRHFPTPKALAFALRVTETLYGVRFREEQVPVWHPDVRYFDMLDAASGEYLAGIYVDLYPREGKRRGAFAAGVRRASLAAGRTPISVLVTNFHREGLNAREMETLMHEFGHVLHGVFSRAEYVSQAGTAVKRDFVEAPSQMFEEWVRREQPLALFAQVCPECPRLSREDIARIEAARRHGLAMQYAGQWLLASFDLALSLAPEPPMQAWKRLEAATPLGHVEGVLRPASFSHVAGSGYAAGYYGYMWSEVIGLDLLTPFERDMLDPAVGRRYRETILSQGGQEEEMEMVRRFLGREPSPAKFFAEITGRR